MADLVQGWSADVDRGPNWLFLRLHGPHGGPAETDVLADEVCHLLRQHMAERLVLEMNDVPLLPSTLIGQLVKLQKRLQTQGGLMRLSGMSDDNQSVLRSTRLDSRFPQYQDREAAVMGRQPCRPR